MNYFRKKTDIVYIFSTKNLDYYESVVREIAFKNNFVQFLYNLKPTLVFFFHLGVYYSEDRCLVLPRIQCTKTGKWFFPIFYHYVKVSHLFTCFQKMVLLILKIFILLL